MARLYASTGDGIARLDESNGAWKVTLSLRGSGAHCLAVDPHDADVAYAGLREGGVRRTSDGGRTWDDCDLAAPGVFSVAGSSFAPVTRSGPSTPRPERWRCSRERRRRLLSGFRSTVAVSPGQSRLSSGAGSAPWCSQLGRSERPAPPSRPVVRSRSASPTAFGVTARPPLRLCQAVLRSRYCRSSCAASSISLCRHSAAR